MFAPSDPDRPGHSTTSAGLEYEFAQLLSAVAPPNHGRIVVLRGSPGLGKTTLTDRLIERATRTGMRVLQADAIPQESKLPFWTIHQLLFPLLSDPSVRDQAGAEFMDALSAAMASPAPHVTEKLRVCRSTLALLSDVSSRTPLVIVVDDAEWMDDSTRDLLCFALNRLMGGNVSLVLVYNRSVPTELRTSRLIEVTLRPLAAEDARRTLLADHPRLPPYVVDRIVDEADGNRLALREYPNMLSRRQLDGRELLPPVLPVPPALLDSYRNTLAGLPSAVRRELVLGAVSGVAYGVTDAGFNAWSPDADVLSRLESLDLVAPHNGNGVHLAGMTIRNVIYSLTPPADLRAAHSELADRYRNDPIRRVLHTAAAASRPDEALATELAAVARLISARGNPGLGLSTLVHAGAMTSSPAAQSEHLTDAARIAASLGQAIVALKLIGEAEALGTAYGHSAASALLRSEIKMRHDGDYSGAARLLEHAMSQSMRDGDANRCVHLAVRLGVLLDDPAFWNSVGRHARAHAAALSASTRLLVLTALPGEPDRLTRPIADVVRDAHHAEPATWNSQQLVQFGSSAWISDCLSEYRSLLTEKGNQATNGGALVPGLEVQLLVALEAFQSGLWKTSEELATSGYTAAASADMGTLATEFRHVRALIAAVRGDVKASDALSDAVDAWGSPRRSEYHRALAVEARLLNHLSQGDSEGARLCSTRILSRNHLPAWPRYGSRLILDVVEAHVRSGHGDAAAEIAAHAVRATGRNHPLRLQFLVAAATALTADGEEARDRFRKALSLDGIDRWPFEQARVEYLYGQWLRRHFANVEARRHLMRARDLFDMLGADPWSRRVGHELRAAGLKANVTNWPAEPLGGELTPQENEVAALAAAGLSNKEIAARLFISPRTVSGHLYRIFPKLNVVSRAGLRDALATRDASESAAAPLSKPNKVI